MTLATQSSLAAIRFSAPTAFVVFACAALGYAFARGHGEGLDDSAATATAPAATLPATEFRPADPSLEVARQHLQGLAGRVPASFGAGPQGDAKSMLARLHGGLGGSKAKEQKRDQMLRDLEQDHASEAIDASWAAQSELSIDSATQAPVMAKTGFKPQDVVTDCRSRSCKISARFDSAIDAHDWAERLLTQMGDTIRQAHVAVVPRAGGGYEVRVYGARKQA